MGSSVVFFCAFFPSPNCCIFCRTIIRNARDGILNGLTVVILVGSNKSRHPNMNKPTIVTPETLQLVPSGQTVVCDHVPQSITESAEPAPAARTERDLFQTANKEHLAASVIADGVTSERDHGGIHLAQLLLQTIRRGQLLNKNKSPGRGRGKRRDRDPPEIILRFCEPKRKHRNRRPRTLSRSQSERVQRSPWLRIPRAFSLRQNRPCPR